jgi:polyprenyldihydroxybenzoate methyltransferase/3-demethylubiquinol 3-O-methyltransferase
MQGRISFRHWRALCRSSFGEENAGINSSLKPKSPIESLVLAEWAPFTSSSAVSSSSVNVREVLKFAKLSDQWWNPHGPFRPLHQMNPIRSRFIRSVLCNQFGRSIDEREPLQGLKLLDVGCGGGILSESLARLGAHVDGIDASHEGPEVAKQHAQRDPKIARRVRYRSMTVEDIIHLGEKFHGVIASEVIEHVDEASAFCKALVKAAVPEGVVILSTINRTYRSYAFAIAAAEKVLGIVPKGTHEWTRFVTPEELTMMMMEAGAGPPSNASGMTFDLLNSKWVFSKDLGVNYIASFPIEQAI